MRTYTVAILGATGAVGRRLIEQLEQSSIPVAKVKLLASARSAGKRARFKDQEIRIEEALPQSFEGVDIVLASAGSSVSKQLLPEAVKRGAVCIDNTSAYRMDPSVPLVVPEVNPEQLRHHQGIIANPNCSTIQMVVALKPIHERFGLKQVVVSTYQAASGAGQSALNEFFQESRDYLDGKEMTATVLPTASEKKHYPLAFNLLPQIDVFEEDGYTHEEWKMIHETKKILMNDMDDKDLKVTATCVRVPVPISHGESVYLTVKDSKTTVEDIRSALTDGEGILVQDDPSQQLYPQPLTAAGKRETFIGRIRPDQENPGAFHLWVVADNLLKGAAWNAVQIAERLVAENLVHG